MAVVRDDQTLIQLGAGAGAVRQAEHPWRRRLIWAGVVVAVIVVGLVVFTGGFPESLVVDSAKPFNAFNDWVIEHQRTHPLFVHFLVPLKNGQNQLVAFDTGLHPWRNQVMPGPWLTNLTASVYKTIPITERVNLRINLDAFNVLNQPGLGLPGGDGIISLRTSAQAARTMQYTARITW